MFKVRRIFKSLVGIFLNVSGQTLWKTEMDVSFSGPVDTLDKYSASLLWSREFWSSHHRYPKNSPIGA